ncbi:MAG: UvrD-helicase domain-containing protein [Acidimicrobiia bacterium]
MAEPVLVTDDEEARSAITSRLDQTLFAEAGAGSGKTNSLVDRVVALVTSDDPEHRTPMREIAAITFTEKAASELRDRIRKELEKGAADPGLSDEQRERCREALDELDSAAISTLHAFAQRLLIEHPIEAGLPPGVEILDEISSQVAFDDRWRRFVDRLLVDPDIERALLLTLATGGTIERFRDVAGQFNANWDLVEERVGDEPDPPAVNLSALIDDVVTLCERRDHCTADDDLMAGHLDKVVDWCAEVNAAAQEGDEVETLRVVSSLARLTFGNGRKGNWPEGCLAEIKADLGQMEEKRRRALDAIAEGAAKRIAAEIGRFTLDEAEERRRAGRLEFHDLLVHARRLLRDPEHGWTVRQRLRSRYTRLLLDEFQDTDPIQIDLAVQLASGDPDAGSKRWSDVDVEPGRLFLVGDPKQSIYRFRRADIAMFLEARDSLGGTRLSLTKNWRTTRPIIEWVNATFTTLIRPEPDSQPEYESLDPVREAAEEGPAVTILGAAAHDSDTRADPLREFEADDVVATIRTAIAEEWSVGDGLDENEEQIWRPARLGDITILLPTRTSLSALEMALDDAGIPYRAESSSLVYATREIRELLSTVRAIDDPTDQLSLATALRSPILGCADDDLFTFRHDHDGVFNHQAPLPDGLPGDHPVGQAMRYLADLHERRVWMSPSELLATIVRDRRLMELGFAQGRPRDLWRRVRFVIDQARAFGEAQGGGLREFLEWTRLQSDDGARVVETVLPETDDDSVRIMTVHGAKGLEFPITILSGMSTRPGGRKGGVKITWPRDGGYGLRLTNSIATEEFTRFQPLDEQMDHHEKLRLLYVAATRARDHLVVSFHRKERKGDADEQSLTAAELLCKGSTDAPHAVELDAVESDIPIAEPRESAEFPDRNTWEAELKQVLARGEVPRTIAATTIARQAAEQQAAEEAREATEAPPADDDPGLKKNARDLELPPWMKGRYGTSIGRAVHAVLQTIDLRTGAGLEETAAAQAAAEGVVGHEERVTALARSALESDTVKEAASGRFWRETYVATPVGDRILEGYVDLIYRTDDGLVVVDYKTDAWRTEEDLDAKLERYRLQGASYALAVSQATGQDVTECRFLFLSEDGAETRSIRDLAAARGTVTASLSPTRLS